MDQHPSCPQCRQIPNTVNVQDKNNEEITCAICLDECTNDIAILSCCSHKYCANCWNSYESKSYKKTDRLIFNLY